MKKKRLWLALLGVPGFLALATPCRAQSNTAPVFNAGPTNYVVVAGNPVLVTNAATDAQSPPQVLVYSLLDSPGGSLINPNTGVVSWTTSPNNAGTVGRFSVVVTDNGTPALSATNSFTVTVVAVPTNTPPGILNQPASVTAAVGANAAFSVTAVGTAPLAYQWFYSVTGIGGWHSIPAATNSAFTLNNVQSTNAGYYCVIVTNLYGALTSATNAQLTVGYAYDLMLGRPTDASVAVSVLANNNLQVYFEYGTQPGNYPGQTATSSITNGVPTALTIAGLQANQQYYYRLRYSTNGLPPFSAGTERRFHTQRARGSAFTFDVEADPHYFDNTPAVWQQTLTNILTDQPDFLVDLGDIFMGEKYAGTNPYTLTQPGLVDACATVRGQFYDIVGHSVPLFMVNGNHDPEVGWLLDSNLPHANPPVWAAGARDLYYPCPIPGGFYSGATNVDYYQPQPRDGYYAFEWGDALFIMLDPFWYSYQALQSRSGDAWSWTLGTNQYYWLKRTLETSTAKYKFVFAHHLIGGSWDTQARGGIEDAPYFEWGGSNTNGTYGFATNRPGWPMPIRDLLLTNHAQVFFHGHDHLFVKQDYYAGGVTNGTPSFIYQEVPQPSHYPYDQTDYATNNPYDYHGGVTFGSSGHLRVTVSPTNCLVEYVRSFPSAYPPMTPGPGITNRMVSYSYLIPGPGTVAGLIATNNLALQWSAQSGLSYVVQWSGDLVNWSNVAVGQTNAWVDTNPISAAPKRFYRLMW